MKFNFKFLVAAVLLLACSNALNWQGAGTWANGNMTVIWDYIHTNFSTSWPVATLTSSTDTTLADFASAFSD
jgi:hypothetical protein